MDLDYGDGDVRPIHVKISKVGPTMFNVHVEKIDEPVRLRTIEEALQHVEDRVTVLTAIGVLDPDMRKGADPRNKWDVDDWSNQAFKQIMSTPVGTSVAKTTSILSATTSADLLARSRRIRKNLP